MCKIHLASSNLIERNKDGVQKEHRQVAELCKNIFIEQLPIVSEALGWK